MQSESYRASDSTAFNENRAGLAGCVYSQHGDVTVHWRDVWKFTADVERPSGHVQIGDFKRLAGPRDRKHPGDSEVSGTNVNAPHDGHCSLQKMAGTFDCTSERVTPNLLAFGRDPSFDPDPGTPKSFLVNVQAYAGISAAYTGKAPKAYSCAGRAGRNELPGGFIGNDFSYGGGVDTVLAIPHSQIADLKVGQTLTSHGITQTKSPGWANVEFPTVGSSCALRATDEHCVYLSASRKGRVTIQRTR